MQAEIHVLHMDVGPFVQWEIESSAARAGLRLKAKETIEDSFTNSYNGCDGRPKRRRRRASLPPARRISPSEEPWHRLSLLLLRLPPPLAARRVVG